MTLLILLMDVGATFQAITTNLIRDGFIFLAVTFGLPSSEQCLASDVADSECESTYGGHMNRLQSSLRFSEKTAGRPILVTGAKAARARTTWRVIGSGVRGKVHSVPVSQRSKST